MSHPSRAAWPTTPDSQAKHWLPLCVIEICDYSLCRNVVVRDKQYCEVNTWRWKRLLTRERHDNFMESFALLRHCIVGVWLDVRTGIFPAISISKDVPVISGCSPPTWAGELWGNPGRKEHLPSNSRPTAATPYGESWGNVGCESTRYWPQIAEERIKGMISVSSGSRILPHMEKC